MSSSYIKDLSNRPTSVVGDQIVQNLIQVANSNGVDPVSCDHTFYGIAEDGTVFSLASMKVTESGTNTQTGSVQFNVFDATGVSTPVLDVNSEGMTVSGGINVTGGNTAFQTSTIEVSDKDLVLASDALVIADFDRGGIILGNDESGTITFLYDNTDVHWNSSTSVNVPSGYAFTVGTSETVLNNTGLNIGEDVSLTSGSLTLSDEVSLKTTGLNIGDISLSIDNGLEIGTDVAMNSSGISLGSVDPVVIDSGGISIGSDLSLKTATGLQIGTDLKLTTDGGLEIGNDISLTVAGGLEIEDISLTSTGLDIGGVNPIALDQTGLSFVDLQLSTSTGLSISSDVVLNSTSLRIGPSEEVTVDNNGISLGSFGSFTKTGGLSLGTGSSLGSDSISFGTVEPTVIDDTSVALGDDILMNHDGLYLTNEQAAVFLGGTAWKIAYDSATQNLLFQFYDSDAGTYVTKTEIKSSL